MLDEKFGREFVKIKTLACQNARDQRAKLALLVEIFVQRGGCEKCWFKNLMAEEEVFVLEEEAINLWLDFRHFELKIE